VPAVTRSGPPRERLQKILAAAGVASRRAAEDLIRAGRVTVNGAIATLGESADADCDAIALDGKPIQREPLEYWIVNKPRGVLTTVSDPQGRSTVIDLAQESTARLFPVGRLDLLSEGLVLLTNDGPLAHSLLHPSFGEEREYRVTVRGSLDRLTLRRISEGVELEDGLTAPARTGSVRFDRETRTTRFALILVEGRKRQIRRMAATGARTPRPEESPVGFARRGAGGRQLIGQSGVDGGLSTSSNSVPESWRILLIIKGFSV
jgi:23S rRNA pseudouridine2605 synthase